MNKIIVYDKNTEYNNFNNYGLGIIKDVKECRIVEELNGEYTLTLTIPNWSQKAQYIKEFNVIRANKQLFRIYNVEENEENEEIKCDARHIFWDLINGFVIDSRAINKTGKEAIDIVLQADGFSNYFTSFSNDLTINTMYFVKNNIVESIMDICKRWKMEYKLDNFNIEIEEYIGKDNGVTFTYRDIQGITITKNTEEVITRIYPVGFDGITLPERYLIVPNYDKTKYPPFYFTREVNFEDAKTEIELRNLAEEYIQNIGEVTSNFTINLRDLKNTTMYKDYEFLFDANIGDLVTIRHKNLKGKIRVIRKEIELVTGDITIELGDRLGQYQQDVEEDYKQEAIKISNLVKTNIVYLDNPKTITRQLSNVEYLLTEIAIGTTEESYNNTCTATLSLTLQAAIESNITFKIYYDSKEILFKPVQSVKVGYNLISFTFALAGLTFDSKLLQIFITSNNLNNIIIEKNQMMLVVTGGGLRSTTPKITPDRQIHNKVMLKDKKIKTKQEINIIRKEKPEMPNLNNVVIGKDSKLNIKSNLENEIINNIRE